MSAPLRASLLLACLCAAGLAGCSSAPTADKLAATGPDPAGAREAAFHMLGHVGLTGTLHKEAWSNGSVAPQDTCNLGGCLMSTAKAEHVTDLTPLLPTGVPTRLQVDLTYQPNPAQFGQFQVFLRTEASTIYSYRLDDDFQGHEVLQAILVPRDAVSLVMAAYGPGGGAPETPYQVKATIDADEHGVPPGVPMAVALAPGQTLRATSPSGDATPFILYAPDDTLVGSFKGEHQVPDGAPAGDYVALLPSNGPWGNLTSNGGSEGMKALGLRREWGTPTPLAPNGATDVPWDVAGNPLGVGLRLAATTPLMLSVGVQASIRGPDGYLFDPGTACQFCLAGALTITTDSGTGDPAVKAGSYTVHGETQGTYEIAVTPFAIYLQR